MHHLEHGSYAKLDDVLLVNCAYMWIKQFST